MATKPPRDERLQLIYYKAGYYAFMVSFPMMAVTISLFANESTRDTLYTPIAAFVTFWAGLGTFVGYLWKKKVSLAEREILWNNPARAKKHRMMRLVTFPLVIGLYILIDYLGTVYFEQEVYVWSENMDMYITMTIMWIAVTYFTELRKPKHLGVEDGGD